MKLIRIEFESLEMYKADLVFATERLGRRLPRESL